MFLFNNTLFDIDKNVKCHDIPFAIYRRKEEKVYDELEQSFLSEITFFWTCIKTIKTRLIVCLEIIVCLENISKNVYWRQKWKILCYSDGYIRWTFIRITTHEAGKVFNVTYVVLD